MLWGDMPIEHFIDSITLLTDLKSREVSLIKFAVGYVVA